VLSSATVDLDRILDLARRFPEDVVILPVAANTQRMARQNDKRGAFIQIGVDDEMVRNLTGDRDRRDLVFCIRIPRFALNAADRRIELPGVVLPQRRAAAR
jgi:hypothetical protein